MTREEEIKKLDTMAKPRSEEAVKKAEERKKQREVIDRACEWLEKEMKGYITVQPYSTSANIDMEGLLDDLKKAIQ